MYKMMPDYNLAAIHARDYKKRIKDNIDDWLKTETGTGKKLVHWDTYDVDVYLKVKDGSLTKWYLEYLKTEQLNANTMLKQVRIHQKDVKQTVYLQMKNIKTLRKIVILIILIETHVNVTQKMKNVENLIQKNLREFLRQK